MNCALPRGCLQFLRTAPDPRHGITVEIIAGPSCFFWSAWRLSRSLSPVTTGGPRTCSSEGSGKAAEQPILWLGLYAIEVIEDGQAD